jgi:hypothetical protein
VNFLESVPVQNGLDALMLVTTLPVGSLVEARGTARIHAQRWAMETGIETTHAWGIGSLCDASFQAIDRLLWIVGLVYALVVLALRDGKFAVFWDQAKRCLQD